MKKNLKKKKGFTLIELIIVIAILGILAAIAIPKFGNVQSNARKKADIASAKTIADTTSMLIADEKIDIGKANVADGSAGFGVNIALTGATGGSGKLIADALNNVPTPKVKGTEFVVTIIQTTGVVTVSVKDASKYYVIYPTISDAAWQ